MSQSIRHLDRYEVEREIDLLQYHCLRLRSARGTDRHRPDDRGREKTYRQHLRQLKKRLKRLPPERSEYGNLITRSLIGTLEGCYAYADRLGMSKLVLPTQDDDRTVALFWNPQALQLLLYCEGDLVLYQCLSNYTLNRETARIRDYYLWNG